MKPLVRAVGIAGAALAFGVGWWARGAATTNAGPRSDEAVVATQRDSPPARREASTNPRSGSTTTVELERAAARFVESGADGLRLDGPPGPDVTGRAVGVDGRPVAGVLVRAEPSAVEELEFQVIPGRSDPDRPVGDLVRELLTAETRRRSGRREAMTDADGRYALTGLVAGVEYDLRATLALHSVSDDDDSRSWNVRPGAVVGFVVEPCGALRVEIARPDGAPVKSATVSIRRERGKDTYDWAPAHDEYTFRPGKATLTASCPGFRSDSSEIELLPLVTVPVRIVLRPVHEVRVHVTWPQGLPHSRVTFRATRDDADVDGSYDDPKGETEGDVATFADLAPGKWWIRAVYPSDRVARRETADTTAGPVDLRWDLPPLDARDFVVVRVLDPGGRPLAGAAVSGSGSYGCTSCESPEARSIEPGVFRVTHARRFDMEGASFEVTAKSDEHGERRVRYRAGVDAEVTVRFPPSAPLSIRVPGDGDGYVRLLPVVSDDAAPYVSGHVDADRVIVFDHVAHGVYDVHADAFPGTAMRVTVPADGVLVYQGAACRAWRVSDVAPKSDAAEAGLRDGDRIVGVDGVEFRDALHREAVWATALTRDRFEADVVRDGAAVRVPLVAERVRRTQKFGASLSESL